MAVLFGCVFEDMLATDLDDGTNVVDDYLKRRGWKESVPNKRYLTALRSSVMSLYEVSDIVRDQSFLARDLLRDGEPVRVGEQMGTRSLKPWDWLAARIVRVGSRTEMAGGALPLRREAGEAVRDHFIALRQELRDDVRQVARDRRGDAELDPYALDTEVLRHAGFLFTNIWLDDALQHALHPELPTLVNTDGETIAFTTVRYPLKPGTDRAALEGGLSAITGLRRADENVWDWSAPASTPAARAPEGQVLASALGEGSVSMGHVELEADALVLETNSPERARKGRALLDPVIGPFVEEPVVDTQTMDELRASGPADRVPARSSGLSPEEERGLVHEFLERHYRGVLDEPVPMLGNLTPRNAAKTKKGREKLVGWLKLLENSAAREQADSAMAGYDLGWMWEELGITDLRR
ncbi:MAG: hypothetical protein JSS04_14510 [Proteobacteria bacterium]|nr:hypothetical protein [Pseudomonadota bacterium]